jgi:hypothetical protein
MDRRLAKTIVSTFRGELRGEAFATFRRKDWQKTYDWLDTSGIALYLLDQITRKGLASEIPPEVVQRLEQNQRDNRSRTDQLLDECVEINTLFRQAGVRFVNLKGITLIPGYCADPGLRFQVDLDFLVEDADADLCKQILESRNYKLTGVCEATWEFKAGRDVLPVLRDMYKPKAQRSVEIHFAASSQSDDRIRRAQLHAWRGFTFPALNESDKFIAQSMHIYEHLRSEWIRLSWVLEYWNYLSIRRRDNEFWCEVRERTKCNSETAIAIGMSLILTRKAFGEGRIPALDEWTTEVLSEDVKRWIERYYDDILLVEPPGSKLYLLLDDGTRPKGELVEMRRRKLLPSRLPPRIVHIEPATPFRAQFLGRWQEFKYLLFRFRFHVTTGLRHVMETIRWKLVS